MGELGVALFLGFFALLAIGAAAAQLYGLTDSLLRSGRRRSTTRGSIHHRNPDDFH